MQKYRYTLSFFITLSLYIVFIGIYIYLTRHNIIAPKTPTTKVINLSLETLMLPPQIPITPDLPEPVTKPTFAHKEIPQIPLHEVISKPTIKTKPPKPHPRKKYTKQKKTSQKTVHPKPIPDTKTVPTPTPVHEIKTAHFNTREKMRFLNTIRRKIDQAKSYPRAAKKRGIQGIVTLSFTVTAAGNITNLHIEGAKVFHTSAKNAVLAAFPIDTTDVPLSFPLDIRLKLHYRIE